MIGATKAVLVVEDEQIVRDPLVDLLRSQGLRAEGAANVAQTLDLVTDKATVFDVAVLDKALKDPDSSSTGIDLGYELRKAQPNLPPEFIVYSAHSEPED